MLAHRVPEDPTPAGSRGPVKAVTLFLSYNPLCSDGSTIPAWHSDLWFTY